MIPLILGYLYVEIREKSDGSVPWGSDQFWVTVLVILLLMTINWWLEAIKWQTILKPIQKVSIFKASQDILKGLAYNWVLPFTSGDLLARSEPYPKDSRLFRALVIARTSSLIITITLGSIGIFYFFSRDLDFLKGWMPYAWWIMGALVILLYLVFTQFRAITAFTFLRYLVFAFQYYLLLKLYLPDLDTSLIMAGISWTFLIRSIVPGFWGAFGIREVSALAFFTPFISDPLTIIFPSFCIWLINIVLPSLLGIVLLIPLRFKIAL
jgi:hypothetical protein